MSKLTGKLRTWSLSSDKNSPGERRYIVAQTLFGIFRNYVQSYTYNPDTQEGEQREQFDRDVNRLYNEIVDQNYTPQVLNASIIDESIVDIDKNGNVTVGLDQNKKLALLDGGGRFRALEKLRSISGDNHSMVDQLPIELLVYLQPEYRKVDFPNLNAGKKINKSHIQSMAIAGGRVNGDKLEIFKRASDLATLLNKDKSSPLCGKVGWGNTADRGLIQFSQLVTDHKGSLIASLFGAAKLLDCTQKDDKYFLYLLSTLWGLFSERSEAVQPGKLLSLPPDGPKGNVSNILSVTNTVLYYLYLQEQIGNSDEIEEYTSHILDCGKIYDDFVSGDVSRARRVRLSGGFAQRLFHPLKDSTLPTGVHMGIPNSLLILTSESSFGVDPLPALKKSRKKKGSEGDD